MALLSPFLKKHIEMFRQDFSLLMNIAIELEKEVTSVSQGVRDNVERYEGFLEDFMKKYPGLYFEVDLDRLYFKPRITLPCRSLSDLFKDVIVHIEGVRSVGESMAPQRIQEDRQRLMDELKPISDRMQVYFVGYSNDYLILKFKDGRAELIYQRKSVIDGISPDFQLCCYIALNGTFEKDMALEMKGFRWNMGYTTSGVREPR
ncbi:MAG: hypothetical protein ABIH34_03375 [Nanoarchaeota archaeon]